MVKNILIEELADSLDELYMMLAEQKEMIEALQNQLSERDKMNVLMVKHVQRLVEEKEFLLKHIGMLSLAKAEKPTTFNEEYII